MPLWGLILIATPVVIILLAIYLYLFMPWKDVEKWLGARWRHEDPPDEETREEG